MGNNNSICQYTTVTGVVNARSIGPKVGIEPIPLAFQASVLTITNTYLSVCVPICEACTNYYTRHPVFIKRLMLTIIYIQAAALYIQC